MRQLGRFDWEGGNGLRQTGKLVFQSGNEVGEIGRLDWEGGKGGAGEHRTHMQINLKRIFNVSIFV